MMMNNDDLRTTKQLEVYYLSNDATANNRAPESIRKDENTPANNTRASIQQKLLSARNVSGSCQTAEYLSSRSYPLQFLADSAGVVLENETGKILECRHLIKNQK